MDEDKIQRQIDEINRKLDVILAEIELQQRRRREMEDLKDDLMRVGKDLYQSAVVELEEVHDHINTGDILYLGKKLLRNVNNLTKMLEQLENLRDFLQDFGPISRELFNDVLSRLHEYERKGYFEFFKELGKVGDRIVTSFTAKDVQNLGDNIVTILNTAKNLTQPDMLQAINNAVGVYKKLDAEVPQDISLIRLLKDLNDPDTRRGLAVAVRFLKNLAKTSEVPSEGRRTEADS
jgi:uncharacterized protein YjgD (DUF1641 family)